MFVYLINKEFIVQNLEGSHKYGYLLIRTGIKFKNFKEKLFVLENIGFLY